MSPQPFIKSTRVGNAVLAIAGIVSAILALISVFTFTESKKQAIEVSSANYAQEIDALKAQSIILKERIKATSEMISRASKDPHAQSDFRYSELMQSVNSVEKRLSNLKKVILDNPEKAVSLPLLRRDIDNIKSSHDTQIATLSANLSGSVNQLYTIIGTVTVVIGVGLLGALFAVPSSNRQSSREE